MYRRKFYISIFIQWPESTIKRQPLVQDSPDKLNCILLLLQLYPARLRNTQNQLAESYGFCTSQHNPVMEHRMHRWMDAYRSGLETKKAQLQVKEFSSRKYKSHRRVLETVACLFD
ncbi:uncharacterized protein HD556DRAFT_1330389 [Suillus plorans]|uniref:Uncharacterized protein n=1 Tax=Suillus plorans TaxID=116603 RepID=A0A9P7DV02_9AGAM|nr:uncharacterized protein HD556DRAFT_1330389 [Suillus plorans]KAG1803806.1 hypothetical protein HD556DRAFT_1330389 [Suillus plorans]